MKIIKIPTSKEKYFLQYLALLYPIHKLRDKEMEVLSQLMLYNDKYKNLDDDVRNKILFNADTKMRIRQKLKMSDGSFNNNMVALSKKGIIKDNILLKAWNIFLDDQPMDLVFKFIIHKEDENVTDNT